MEEQVIITWEGTGWLYMEEKGGEAEKEGKEDKKRISTWEDNRLTSRK